MTAYDKKGKVVRLKKDTIDLRHIGNLDYAEYFSNSIARANKKSWEMEKLLETDDKEWDTPTFELYPQKEKISWLKFLAENYKSVFKIILP